MGSVSMNKLGGFSLFLGAFLHIVGSLIGVAVSDGPPEGGYIFEAFAASTATAGKVQHVVVLLTTVGLALTIFGIVALQEFVRNRTDNNAVIRLGSFLFTIGGIGLIYAWSFDNGLLMSEPVGMGAQAMMAASQFSLFIVGGVLAWSGVALIALQVSLSPDFSKILGFVATIAAVVVGVAHILAPWLIDSADAGTVGGVFIPVFAGMFIVNLWFLIVGRALASKDSG